MTDVDRLLSEDGARWRAAQPPASEPAPLLRPRRSAWPPVAAAAAVVALVAVTVGLLALRPTPAPDRSGAAVEPPLVGTVWQLVSYRPPGAAPVAVREDSTFQLSPKGTFGMVACNAIGGPAHVAGGTVQFGLVSSTDMACTDQRQVVEQQVHTVLEGHTAGWAIRDRTLTLTGGDGTVLTYRVRASIYPDQDARTLLSGDRAGGQFRLSASGGTGDVPLGLEIETRTGPGEGFGTAGMTVPGPKDCLADGVLSGSPLGGEQLLVVWAPEPVATVGFRAKPGGPEITLPPLHTSDPTLRLVGTWTAGFRPSVSQVTFYDRSGVVLAAYPNGPC